MQIAWSAWATWAESASASEYTATERKPNARRVRMIRQAMAPRLATRTVSNMMDLLSAGRPACGFGAAGRPAAGQRSRGIPDQAANRRRVVCIARIVQLRTVGDQHDQVHLSLHLNVLAGRRDAVGEGQAALRCHRHVHEEIDVG